MLQRSENVDLSLSIPQSNFQTNGYDMGDQVSVLFLFILSFSSKTNSLDYLDSLDKFLKRWFLNPSFILLFFNCFF